MKIAKAKLEELGLPYSCDGGKIVATEMIEHSRWSVLCSVTFQLPEQLDTNKAYQLCYNEPATECQDTGGSVFEYEDDEMDLDEVVYRECTIKAWAPIDWDKTKKPTRLTLV